MHNKKFMKETFWAVCIILVCILTVCFLFFKTTTKVSEDISLFSDNKVIFLDSINSQQSVSAVPIADSTESLPLETINETIESSAQMNDSVPENIFSESPIHSYNCPIDFESLWETNEDVYAWITIPGTIIDYPILQHETDNSYYLNYTIDGIEGYPGCIYTENINAKDFTDNNTVIYGHNMRNGTMFTDLHKFRNAEFFKENDTVYIYTPEKQLTYKVFAAYLYDDRHLMSSFNFSDREIYSNYLSEIQTMDSEDVNIRKEIQVTDADKIITLITCIREEPEKRVYVQAVLESYDL